MSNARRPRLYDLLPAFHRVRDTTQGEPLRALLEILDSELDGIEGDVERLYENWFIETCDDWVVPYLGDLMRVPTLRRTRHGRTVRAYVANTIRYRRRKGTAAVVEQLARDVTRWPARVVEFFQRLAWNQHMNHVRPDASIAPDMRRGADLERVGTPFDQFAHTVDVRRTDSTGPRYNLPNLGVFFWRLQAYPVRKAPAWSPNAADGRFHIHRLGHDAPLFHTPRTETEITHLAEEVDVPGKLRRRPLYDELEARRVALAEGRSPHPVFFDASPPFRVRVDGESDPIPPEEISICDLSGPPLTAGGTWRRPPNTKSYLGADGSTVSLPIRCGVDPVLGRIAFPAGSAPAGVHVDYAYGFPADIGGGPYRTAAAPTQVPTWSIQVGGSLPDTPGVSASSIQKAVGAYLTQPAGTVGRIEIVDSGRYKAPTSIVRIKPGGSLAIVARGQVWPHVHGSWRVRGVTGGDAGALHLEGLLLEGTLQVLAGDLGRLRLSDVTLARSIETSDCRLRADSTNADGQRNDRLVVEVASSVVGPISLSVRIRQLTIDDSIVDPAHGTGSGIQAASAHLTLRRSTVLGETHVRVLDASDAIFVEEVVAQRTQVGCVRYSFVPPGSRTPRRFRCEPDLALARRAQTLGLDGPGALSDAEAALVARATQPGFVSTKHGQPAFAQLDRRSSRAIRTGGEHGSEMGAYSQLEEALREANFVTAVQEYVRFGLEVGFDHVT